MIIELDTGKMSFLVGVLGKFNLFVSDYLKNHPKIAEARKKDFMQLQRCANILKVNIGEQLKGVKG